jgi:hypothetical protein
MSDDQQTKAKMTIPDGFIKNSPVCGSSYSLGHIMREHESELYPHHRLDNVHTFEWVFTTH